MREGEGGNSQAVLPILVPGITSSSWMKASETTLLGKTWHIVFSLVLCSEDPLMATRSLAFSLRFPFHLLNKVLLLKGILQFHTSLSGYCFFFFLYWGLSHLSVPIHTMPMALPELMGKYMSYCLKMLPRKHWSPWPRLISFFVFCYPDQKILLLPQCRMCQNSTLQPEKYQCLP